MFSEDQADVDVKLKASKRGGAPRWMVTFADLMSLLFALFVLLVSFANFDEKKFALSSGPMREAFNVAGDVKDDTNNLSSGILTGQQTILDNTAQRKEVMLRRLDRDLVNEIAQQMVSIEERDKGILIRFPNTTAFGSGGAELSQAAHDALNRVINVLARGEEKIVISGHTDDIPISNERFRSNWDLSSARAASVVHYFLDHGIAKKRVTAQGLADSRPLAPNDTKENRATNRRVEIYIEFDEKKPKSLLDLN